MRRNIVAGNWKMNLLAHEAAELFNEVQFFCNENPTNCEVFVFPSSIYLAALKGNAKKVTIGAQNVNEHLNGAFTGEVSPTQLSSIGITYSLIGHSERRSMFSESDELVNRKVKVILENEIDPILCIGETLEQRESNNHFKTIEKQIEIGLQDVADDGFARIIIAYEPVWAIGTGVTASPEQAQEMHAYIRKILARKFGDELASNCSILYGGSVKPGNARELFSNEDVDGGLVGGASLTASDFISIIQAFD